MKSLSRSVLAALVVLPLAFLAAPAKATEDIVDTAIKTGRFTTLVTALKAAGLVETLKGPGPFTVFAPTDAAFAKLPKGTVEDLLKPENKPKLTAILTYHVVPGKIMSNDLEAPYAGPGLPNVVPPGTPWVAPERKRPLKTLEGSELVVDATRGSALLLKVPGIKLEAKVEPTDMVASNGVIHVIDTVLMPNK